MFYYDSDWSFRVIGKGCSKNVFDNMMECLYFDHLIKRFFLEEISKNFDFQKEVTALTHMPF